MFSKQTIWAVAMATSGFAQTPPPAPAAPPAPRILRGHSVVASTVSKRGYLGVGVVGVSPERAKSLKLTGDAGVEVKHVDDESPAFKAGLKENDVILELNGQKVDEVDQFVKMVGDSPPDSKLEMSVWRNGGKVNLTARPGARRTVVMATPNGFTENFVGPRGMEEFFPSAVGDAPRVGFEGEMLTQQLAAFFGVKEGVLVRTVVAGSAAEKAGLRAGDVVTKVNGTPVSSPREVSSLLRASRKSATFTLTRNHKEITVNVEIAEDRSPSPDRLVL